MFVFWVLVLILAVVLWFVLTHFLGVKTYNGAEKIYKDFIEEETNEKGESRNDV